jgi:hypothetical protein
MTEVDPERPDDPLREEQEGKGYGEDEGEREAGLDERGAESDDGDE